jgi:hypothetical protein
MNIARTVVPAVVAALLVAPATAGASKPRKACPREAAVPGAFSATSGLGCSLASYMAADLADRASARFPRALPRTGLRATMNGDIFRCRNRVTFTTAYDHPVMRQEITCIDRGGQSFRVTLKMA